jgi:hypothetical protein
MGPIKAAGKYRQEGKSYVGGLPSLFTQVLTVLFQVVQDGDIIHFQFSKSNPR